MVMKAIKEKAIKTMKATTAPKPMKTKPKTQKGQKRTIKIYNEDDGYFMMTYPISIEKKIKMAKKRAMGDHTESFIGAIDEEGHKWKRVKASEVSGLMTPTWSKKKKADMLKKKEKKEAEKLKVQIATKNKEAKEKKKKAERAEGAEDQREGAQETRKGDE